VREIADLAKFANADILTDGCVTVYIEIVRLTDAARHSEWADQSLVEQSADDPRTAAR